MRLNNHKQSANSLFTFFDNQEKVVIYPTSYLRYLKKHNRPKTSQKHIAQILKLHCEWIEQSGQSSQLSVDSLLKATSHVDILDWIEYQRKLGTSETTIHNREILLREFYKWLTTSSAGNIREDTPWGKKSFTRKPHRPLPRFVTKEQVVSVIKGLYNENQRLMVHFLFDTGLRVSELINLTNSMLPNEKDWSEQMNYFPLLVPGSKSFDGNQYKYRFTILSRAVLARIRRYHSTLQYSLAKGWGFYDPNKPVFLNVNGSPLTISAVQKAIRKACVRVGRDPREVSPHRLRHGTAFSILQSELGQETLDNLLIVKSIFGHQDIKTTEVYTSIPLSALKMLNNQTRVKLKYEEAQEIYDATYLPKPLNTEKRGHKE